MPFLGLMTVASHKEILDKAKAEAFHEGSVHQQKFTPAYRDRQPEINSLQGQLDAANDLKDGYVRTIEKQKQGLAKQAEITAEYIADAQKWRNRRDADRKRQAAKRAEKLATAPKAPAKKAAPRKARK